MTGSFVEFFLHRRGLVRRQQPVQITLGPRLVEPAGHDDDDLGATPGGIPTHDPFHTEAALDRFVQLLLHRGGLVRGEKLVVECRAVIVSDREGRNGKT